MMIASNPPAQDSIACLLDRLTWSKAETAEQFATSPRNIDALVIAGKFPQPVMLSSSRRWRVEELKQWVADGMPDLAGWEWPVEK